MGPSEYYIWIYSGRIANRKSTKHVLKHFIWILLLKDNWWEIPQGLALRQVPADTDISCFLPRCRVYDLQPGLAHTRAICVSNLSDLVLNPKVGVPTDPHADPPHSPGHLCTDVLTWHAWWGYKKTGHKERKPKVTFSWILKFHHWHPELSVIQYLTIWFKI